MDVEQVRQAQGGDKRAYTAVAQAVLPRLLGVAERILRDASLAEDATQQALLRAWRDLPSLRDPARFEGWVYRMLVRACYDEARRRRRWRFEPLSDEHIVRAPDAHGNVHERDRVERAMRALSVDHRTVLVLRYYLDWPIDDIAEALGVPPGTVNSRLHRAHAALRATLDADARMPTRATPSEAM